MSYLDHAAYGDVEHQHVIFTHPVVSNLSGMGDLVLRVNPYEIIWSYGLNTANYSTYGGEVVQILSIFFDDMSISGEVRAYSDMERIYKWFLTYMSVATQGTGNSPAYNAQPVIFQYPHRGWEFQIYPKAMPSFKYGRDVVVPSYSIQAAVLEPEPALEQAIIQGAQTLAAAGDDVSNFGKATAGIGFREDNPFSGPSSQIYKKPGEIDKFNQDAGDFFTNLIPSWAGGDFSDLQVSSKVPDPIMNIIKQFSNDKKTKGRKGGKKGGKKGG